MGFNFKGCFWLSLWFILNVSTALLNKAILSKVNFKFPIILSFVHMAISTLFSFIQSLFREGYYVDSSHRKGILSRVLLLSILFTLNIVVGNFSLNLCSLSFTQIMRATIPIITMTFSILFLSEKYTIYHAISCVIVCCGVALACYSDMELTAKGFFVTLLSCILSSTKSILTRRTLVGDFSIPSSELLSIMAPIAAIEMFCLTVFTGENDKLITSTLYTPSPLCTFGVLLSAVIAFFLNLTNFNATFYTSSLTVSMCGNVKQVTTITLSVLIFDKKITPLNMVGIGITLLGSIMYSLLPKVTSTEKKQDDLNLLLANKKSFGEEDDDDQVNLTAPSSTV